jgi:hypothetical protein
MERNEPFPRNPTHKCLFRRLIFALVCCPTLFHSILGSRLRIRRTPFFNLPDGTSQCIPARLPRQRCRPLSRKILQVCADGLLSHVCGLPLSFLAHPKARMAGTPAASEITQCRARTTRRRVQIRTDSEVHTSMNFLTFAHCMPWRPNGSTGHPIITPATACLLITSFKARAKYTLVCSARISIKPVRSNAATFAAASYGPSNQRACAQSSAPAA